MPIQAEIHVDNYRQSAPTLVPGAQVAWIRPYESGGELAVAYSMQWNNPAPDREIASIDLLPGADAAGVPALLALTAATAK